MRGPKAQFNQRSGIGKTLGLPALIGLIVRHGCFGFLVPNPVWLAIEIVLMDKRRLDLKNPILSDDLLAMMSPGTPALAGMASGAVRFAGEYGGSDCDAKDCNA